MRTALYIRVSTEEQAKEGYSIRAQTDRLKAYCVSQGWEIVDFYVDDGQSAKDMERTNLKRMIQHIENGLIECVLVYKLDRLTRSVLDLYKLLEIFDAHGCKFKSATEVYDTTTAMGRMFITIVAALAQWERENLSERVRMGMEQKAREGQWVINVAPYGYDLDKDNKSLIVNEAEALVVKRMFNMYLSGKGMHKIALELNALNILNKSGNNWTGSKIGYILRNPTYIGTIRYNYRVHNDQYFEVENSVPAIIDPVTFNKVQSIATARKTAHPKAATSEFIFSGTIKCARCGAPLSGKYGYSKRGEKIYRPRSYYCSKQILGLCDQRNMSELFIERHFLNYLQEIEIDQDDIQDLNPVDDQKETQEQIMLLEKDLRAIEQRRKKWQYAWVNNMIDDKDFSARMEEENTTEAKIREELDNIKPATNSMDPIEFKTILQEIRTNWQTLTAVEKKMMLQLLVKKIVVDKISPRPRFESVEIVEIEFY
ncbi:recombinase family protein [Priestia flexa]|uniref:Recombinase family protein n=1 Tax=Priestia flexa TaxID=86664 RepID=A0ABU4J4D7_9BACI|nr:recombinase family protein [Priestia flexa]MDW8515859.1 recombinase family protein [Priestia flexa]